MAESEAGLSNTTTNTEESASSSSTYDKESHYEPIQQTGTTTTTGGDHPGAELKRQTSTRSTKSLERSSSLGDGYTHPRVDHDRFQEEEDVTLSDEERAAAVGIEAEFVVGWDGAGDMGNPRNMSYARKWVIVLILSMGSCCV